MVWPVSGLAFRLPLIADLSLTLQRTRKTVAWQALQSGQSAFELAVLPGGAILSPLLAFSFVLIQMLAQPSGH